MLLNQRDMKFSHIRRMIMKSNVTYSILIFLVVMAAVMTACSPAEKIYSDPFAYCAAVGTIDTPDARYTGPQISEQIINGFKTAAAWKQALSRWRCSRKRPSGAAWTTRSMPAILARTCPAIRKPIRIKPHPLQWKNTARPARTLNSFQ